MKPAARGALSRSESAEILSGAVILTILLGFVLAGVSGIRGGYSSSTELLARFARADGIAVDSEVRIGGVRVGRVIRQELDEHNRAVLTLGLDPGVVLDNQASASIATDGLFGAKHIDIELAGGEAELVSGGEIALTEPAMLIEA